jgi:dihydroxyacid dehydratase/phosphogluconate dehydratase
MTKKPEDLRSHRWFGVETMRSANHRSRLLQLGYDAPEFRGKPLIGIINTWSDLMHCHGHFRERAQDVKRGVWQAGGVPMELPAMALPEVFQKPSTMLYRNFLSMETEELARSLPIDGLVLMGAATRRARA